MFRSNGRSYAITFALVSTLFFLWGFCNGMIDVLNKHFQNSLHISKAESGFVQSNSKLFIPYLFIAAIVGVLLILFWRAEIPDLQAEDDALSVAGSDPSSAPSKALLNRWHFTLAVGAQFFYVAAQVGIWGFFINYVTSPDTPDLPEWLAKSLFSGWTYFGVPHINGGNGQITDLAGAIPAWHITDLGGSWAFTGGMLCFLAGRFIGSMALRIFSAHATLALFGVINSLMMILIILHLGWISVAAIFLSCFFMSIMYPTIFALGIRGLGEDTKLGSSLIVMAIVGGAIMPFLMGWLADTYAMRYGFIMPLICFIYVAVYAAIWPWLERLDTGHEVAD